MTIENRSRVPSGVRTGGQFAAEAHAEATGVTLTRSAPSSTDQAVLSAVGDLVRTNANFQLAEWERRLQAQQLPWHSSSDPATVAPERVKAVQQAKEFESLSRDEQEQLLDAVKLSGVKHLLEPGQKLGTDRIHVAEGLELQDANLAMVLTAQAEVHNANLPGTITLTGIGDVAAFDVQDGDLRHELRIGSGLVSMSPEVEDGDPYVRGDWLWRADQSTFAGSILEGDRSAELVRQFGEYRKFAVLMDVVASSPLKDSGDEIGELDVDQRTAQLKSDGTDFILDVSGDTPTMRTDAGNLHPSMIPGFLDHVARQSGHVNGQAFAADLREVFNETERRLAN
jgi:hypothetical protein